MRLLFMGTPQFAVPTLEKLIELKNHDLIGVYTKHPKPANRGHKLEYSPIYKVAETNGLPLYTPKGFKKTINQEVFKELKPDLVIVVAYGLIIPEAILDVPKYGFINVHPSLLPKWRGSAPIQRCMLSDDTETGVCIMQVDAGIDSGDILRISPRVSTDNIEFQDLENKLASMGSELVADVIHEIELNGYIKHKTKQDDTKATIADKISKSDGLIDFQNSSIAFIDKQIRTLSKCLGTYFIKNDEIIKIIKADFVKEKNTQYKPGTIINKDFHIQCQDGILKPLILQKQGKKVMGVKDFINGYKFQVGDIIESQVEK